MDSQSARHRSQVDAFNNKYSLNCKFQITRQRPPGDTFNTTSANTCEFVNLQQSAREMSQVDNLKIYTFKLQIARQRSDYTVHCASQRVGTSSNLCQCADIVVSLCKFSRSSVQRVEASSSHCQCASSVQARE